MPLEKSYLLHKVTFSYLLCIVPLGCVFNQKRLSAFLFKRSETLVNVYKSHFSETYRVTHEQLFNSSAKYMEILRSLLRVSLPLSKIGTRKSVSVSLFAEHSRKETFLY